MSAAFEFESSGKMKFPSDEELAKLDKDNALIAYTSGIMEDGQPYYAFVAVKPSLYEKFYELTAAKQTIILGEYGEIIEAGIAFEPPLEVLQKIRDQYGYDPHYEKNLLKEALKQQVDFMRKKEDERIAHAVNILKKNSPNS